MHKWGHLALLRHLANEPLPVQFTGAGASVICQYSSQGSLSEKWMGEFYDTLCSGKPQGMGCHVNRVSLVASTPAVQR